MKWYSIHLDIATIVFMVMLLNSCKPESKRNDCQDSGNCPPTYYRIKLQEPKSYLWSLPGSYWIYKNSVTGELDTQTCTGFYFDSLTSKGTGTDNRVITLEYDYLERIIRSSFNQWNYRDHTGYNSPNQTEFNNGATILDRSADGPGYIKPFFYPFQNGLIYSNGSSSTTCKGMDSTMTIQGKTYSNVAKFDIDMDDIWYPNAKYPNAIYYWSKDVGLIKRENKTENFSWELIEYNIVK